MLQQYDFFHNSNTILEDMSTAFRHILFYMSQTQFDDLRTHQRATAYICHKRSLMTYARISVLHLSMSQTQFDDIKKDLKSLDLKSFFSWATRIRTLKMLESESSALPFGDSPLPQQMILYTNWSNNASFFFRKLKKF